MSKARRSPKPKSKAVEKANERELRELVVFLEENAGFQLGLAAVDSITTRRTQLDRLADRPVHLTQLDLGKFPGETQILERLQAHLRDHPAPEGERPAVMVIGLEAHLDYREPEPGKVSPQPILRNANMQRDAFPRLCPVPVVFWLLPSALTLFAREAPDLWHWRSGSFRFNGPPGTRRELEERQVKMPSIDIDNLPREEKAERIASLQDLLRELENAGDRETKGNKARRANLLNELSIAYSSILKFEQSLSFAREAADLYRQVNSPVSLGAAIANLAGAYSALGQPEKAIGYYEQALSIARRLGHLRGEGLTLGALGIHYIRQGEAAKSVESLEIALSIARQLRDLHEEEAALGNLGNAYGIVGQMEKAISYFEEALSIARDLGDLNREGVALCNLGTAHIAINQAERAIGYLEQSLAIARGLGDRRREGQNLFLLASAYGILGQMKKAARLHADSLATGWEANNLRIPIARELDQERLLGEETE